MKKYYVTIVFSMFWFFLATAQSNDRTITVSGTSEFNLSPNEIIVKINFQEYFLDESKTPNNKITIEVLEEKVLKAIYKTSLVKEKVTVGSVQMIRPYVNGVYKKRRLNKSLFVCVENAQQYINLTRVLETDGLFEKGITDFSITQYRHTEKKAYLIKSRSEAYQDAVDKAKLILSKSGQQLGEVVKISELTKKSLSNRDGSFYAVESPANTTSGFKPILISYDLQVVFKIL